MRVLVAGAEGYLGRKLVCALLQRGAFRDFGPFEPADLAFVRLKPNGEVFHESILQHGKDIRSARDLSEDAWSRLERLLARSLAGRCRPRLCGKHPRPV